MRILVIDDEAQIRRLLEITFASRGWEVFLAEDGYEGLQTAQGSKPDVVLLDLNLPDMTGEEVLLRLREWSTVPVIVISVRNAQDVIVALLNRGADDFVTKPFHTGELIARIEAVHRRRAPEREIVFVCGRLRIDRESHEVAIGESPVRLTPTEYAILELLARNSGKIVTRDRILREVWGPSGDAEEGNLRVYISSLRKKIESDPVNPELLLTEPGVGYRLLSPAPAQDSDSP